MAYCLPVLKTKVKLQVKAIIGLLRSTRAEKAVQVDVVEFDRH